MNLTPINVYISNNMQENNKIKEFSLYLCDVLASLKLIHWYSLDYNLHKILNKTYESFDGLFDKLIEELIGICQDSNSFLLDCPERDIKKVLICSSREEQINEILSILKSLENTIKNQNMESIINKLHFSGINNIIEEILSESNKCKYLLKMIK